MKDSAGLNLSENHPPSSRNLSNRVALCCSEDSYLPHCIALDQYFNENNFKVDIIDIHFENSKENFSLHKKEKWNIEFDSQSIISVKFDNLSDLISGNRYDFVFLGMPGHLIFKYQRDIFKLKSQNRNLIFLAGFPGLQHYTKFSGIVNRGGVDILLFIDPSLHRLARSLFCCLPIRTAECLLMGSPRIQLEDRREGHEGVGDYILFFDQNVVPSSRSERENLARIIRDIGRRYQDKRLLLVRRNKPGERSNHAASEDDRIERILVDIGFTEFEIFDGNWLSLKNEIFLAFGVSSTALLETASMGIPSLSILFTRAPRTNYDAAPVFLKCATDISRVPWDESIWILRLGDVSRIFVPFQKQALDRMSAAILGNTDAWSAADPALPSPEAKWNIFKKIARQLDKLYKLYDGIRFRGYILIPKIFRGRLRKSSRLDALRTYFIYRQ